ncbi:hypothetical protein HY745_02450, partial [Candidatus Desantisbacteria bacterium]|nr:hypothetical protein [Candidatus Desantisbacteria bacterium]
MENTRNDLFKNQYRIKSTRLSNWDYSSNGYYFITICTHNREHYFGEIGEITTIGKIAQKYWLEIPNHFPFVILNEFVIMPNHIHGILIIENTANFSGGIRHGPIVSVETCHGMSLQQRQQQTNNNQ